MRHRLSYLERRHGIEHRAIMRRLLLNDLPNRIPGDVMMWYVMHDYRDLNRTRRRFILPFAIVRRSGRP